MALVESAAASGAGSGTGAALASGVASIGGGILGGLLDFPIQKSFVTKQSRHQRKWAEYMSNTAYQRAVADLRAAGLNPMLAYTQGGAAGGSYQQAQVPDIDPRIDVEGAVSSAKSASAYRDELRAIKAQADEAVSRAAIAANERKSSDAFWKSLGEAQVEATRAGAEASSASAQAALGQRKIVEQTEKQREAEAAAAGTITGLRETEFGKALLVLREFLRSVR